MSNEKSLFFPHKSKVKINKIVKFQIIYSFLYAFVFYSIFLPLAVYCSQNTQTVYITKEDIENATPISPYKVHFSLNDLKAIETMEKRHFSRIYPEFEDFERLKNLEYELFGRIWEYSPQNTRIEKLKLASSHTCLSGMALPALISSKENVKKMMKTDSGLRPRDNVGLIDGFLRLLSPEKYEIYRKTSDDMFYKYEK